MRLSKKEVEHVALLARLHLSEEEKESYTHQLNAVMDYMEKLRALNTEGVEPTAHVLPLRNIFREDAVRPGLPREKALEGAPAAREGQFKVPRVV
ncbi:MAG: Asp-tRNA(Asn)/Glu-tRNA(Gln) amidotransferase subunit GatC [Thermoanaerobacteraceae bacterium]|uniref:Asp-tRNA(Asn)/Glu-tRNA(Gln) amidotransferase subunit GatC n=1 Tax=Thermanaeromonas sp. C210 TaxID=2731925 RepID=UPI000E7D8A4D|nr:Asp-tRNA(Asn)/Glu-tRNA(Gln) amidotransferase subunit GatC [Thermanaeromonas sp. C210]MBE3581942.1 Asp-tRNA(Asn)/Glu-tRNA(Gln) amidotransferase subunit GatC [Thermoanaerobacteraceae bacterium]GFN22253.1 aspartyl/glutamyl-tRNA(Asn/Gln) amidotransferase subunit C [Thermanaeromonas sp. C210]HBT46628.1 Asp-tRNA(Asn)/Glu-tRNA(Gln) amidotransferase subunit GatB [Peptococcaceae bacterium]